ncbi:MAG: hypothetical protein JWN45_1342 [Acidobacteriaceae bacterium]|nr:hypothetical protein [Acidobacteriaceae bacterium]
MPEHRDELPKIAQSRLRQQASGPAGLHLDANILTAFVEGGLSGTERSTTLAHLASCAECREIVALSLPEQESATVNANVGAAVWNWTRMLQWGAVAASVVVVASAVLLLNSKQTKPADNIEIASQVPSERTKETQAAPALQSTDPDASKAKKPEELRESDKAKANIASKPAQTSASKVAPEPAISGGTLKDGTAANRFNPKSDYFSGGAAPAVGAANGQSYHGQASQSTAKKSDVGNGAADYATNNSGFVGGALAQQGRSFNVAPAPPPEQKPANAPEANINVFSKSAAPSPAFANSRAKAEDSKSADKISSASETVEVTAQAVPMNSITARSLPARFVNDTSTWMINPNGKLLTRRDTSGWKEVALADNPHLITLTVKSNDIWVAGVKGALYHSTDAGKTWALVKGGWPSDSDIVQLIFTDPQHVALQTAKGERWATDDGGKTWVKK